jgi:hypothetical protein
MIINKIIETSLTINNPIDVYSDSSKNIMNILIHKFKNKCYKGVLILDIIKIVQSSECIINQHGGECSGVMNIRFEVQAVVYNTSEVITGCLILKKDQGIIIASSQYASIMMTNHKSLDSIAIGNIIPVCVAKASYSINSNKISVNAFPYFPSKFYWNKTIPIYQPIDARLSADDKRSLEVIMARVQYEETEQKQWEGKNKDKLEFFRKLLFPIASPDFAKISPEEVRTNLLALISSDKPLTETNDVLLIKDIRIPLNSSDILVVKKEDLSKMPTYLDCQYLVETKLDLRSVIQILLIEYCDNLKLIRELMETYDTDEKMADHVNLWKVLKLGKF